MQSDLIESPAEPRPVTQPRMPAFYDDAPTIVMRDPLAEFLGAARDGILEYRYTDAVRMTGHSCPTVAAAYMMTRAAMRALYPGSVAERGGVAVAVSQACGAGVTGVTASVATLITGAAGEGGFPGLGGRFRRRGLLDFGVTLEQAELRFSRIDGGPSASVTAHLSQVPGDPRMVRLMSACLNGTADPEQVALFRSLWQDRVRRILLDHADDPEVIVVRMDDRSPSS